MKRVRDVLKRKGNLIVSVGPTTIVRDALKTMAEKNIGSIIIMENGKYLGLMTERDYARKVILQGRSSKEVTVAEILSTDHPHVTNEHTIDSCMEIMGSKSVRYLPVFDGETLIGLVSLIDVIKEINLQQKETIQHLESYIHS